jgi:hypothetical protein
LQGICRRFFAGETSLPFLLHLSGAGLEAQGVEGGEAGGAAPEVCIPEVAAGDGLVKHARMMKIKSDEL